MHYYFGDKKSWLLTSGFLVSSIIVSMIYYQAMKWELSFKATWTATAAEEAEAVAAYNCSGHGRAYLDGRYVNGARQCECNNCYNGTHCELLVPGCPADVRSGDAMFLEKYWMEKKSRSATLIPAWHRMSYYFDPLAEDYLSYTFTSHELADHIRSLHKVVRNAKADDKFIVFGNGVTQLLTGLVISLSQERFLLPDNEKAKVVADVPYYPVFRKQTNFFRYKGYEWAGNASDYTHAEKPEDFIELVTSPNNPDGKIKDNGKIGGALAIHDLVYYWPHYTAINRTADDDIMLFSLSKLTGHAGSRFGWALIKDKKLYVKLLEYMIESSEGTSHDTQLRTLKVVKEIADQFNSSLSRGSKDDIFDFGYRTLSTRWRLLNNLVSSSDRFSLQLLTEEHCHYFGIRRQPSPAYGWLKCEWEEDKDCQAVLKNGLILSQGGELFDTTSRYARLSLIKTDDDFNQMMEKLKPLVFGERA